MPYMIFVDEDSGEECSCEVCRTKLCYIYVDTACSPFRYFLDCEITGTLLSAARIEYLLAPFDYNTATLYDAICQHRGLTIRLFWYEHLAPIEIKPVFELAEE